MLEVAPYEQQLRMDTFVFFKQFEIWHKRAEAKVAAMKQK